MSESFTGNFLRGSSGSEYATMEFIVRRILGRSATNTLVQVKAVHPGTGSVGFVDVQPMVNQIDGSNKATPHDTVYNLPYFRLQGGVCAIIIDPAVGDIGMASFASEDISSVKKNRAVSNPGSRRRFSMPDGLYVGGFLNGTPTQFIQFDPEAGITITSADGQPVNINAPGGANVTAPTTTITGDVTVDGDMMVTGKTTTADFQATGAVDLDAATISGTLTADTLVGTTDVIAAGKSGASHHHGGVQTGGGNTGGPV